ncbi:site-specific integrase [Saccharopolyspora hattusasensis]|uniref:site-specific integrase n=1 Tax=Saccharopolyspora hattusasensis TaxID=1128679 RepID=UPI003D96595E
MTAAAAALEAKGDEEITAGLWEAIEPEFVTLLGWDPAVRILSFPQEHPLLGWKECLVEGCEKIGRSSKHLCAACHNRWQAAEETPWEEFLVTARRHWRSIGAGRCSVPSCPRPWKSARLLLCGTHYAQHGSLRLPLAEFLAHPDVVALPAYGQCLVEACTRDRGGAAPYCSAHKYRWKVAQQRGNAPEEGHWRRTTSAVAENNTVSLRGLPPRVVAEVIHGLQERTKQGIKNNLTRLRPLCDLARSQQVASLGDLDPEAMPNSHRGLHKSIVHHAVRRRLTPESERHKDVWELSVFGMRGTLRFTEISQPWLREATKKWAFDDLPRHRGTSIRGILQSRINSIAQLSTSLRLQREDHGSLPALLLRADITAFCNRLAYLTQQGTISAYRRIVFCRDVRLLLSRMRAMGLTRQGEPMSGMPDEFTLGPDDIPDEPEDAEAGRDLPPEVMRHLCAHLQLLEDTSCTEIRVAVELLIDTGRRPDEICQLALDCLERDADGKPMLVYDNIKTHRHGRRLPIPAATAAAIAAQQQCVRLRFPAEPTDLLKLLPAPARNPHGRRSITDNGVTSRHRKWVDALPDILVPIAVTVDSRTTTKMLPFDKRRIFPYAFRHTYAQRHADAGVPVDVLRELMDHRQILTAQRYYRVGEERRREAVERVTTMQFDRHGNRVWRQAKAMLDSEHARRAVGEVAVPYGGCSEPSNVAAGGHDCPVRFRCIGCGHFSSDVSFLPDLQAYHDDLLRNRERLLAALDADDWAKSEAMPSDEEITRIRRLINRMNADLADLSDEERSQIEDAIALVRRTRSRVVGLGMPRVRQPLPDIRPDRSA